MRKAGAPELDDYLTRLERGRLPISDLIDELTVGETYFFREPDQFAFLGQVVLPEIAQRKEDRSPVRIWSAGCASGEEAYSLAILLEEVGLGDRGHVLGTDISRHALTAAARAEYGSWSLRGPDAFRARRYLTGMGNALSLDPEIRSRVAFQPLNLARDVFPSREQGIGDFDLILCRNVLIYFDAATIAHVAAALYRSLADDGWLVLASSDPPLAQLAPFRTVVTERGVFYRRRETATRDHAPRASQHSPSNVAPPRVTPPPVVTPRHQARARPASPRAGGTRADTGDLAKAEEAAKVAVHQAPLSPEAHYLYALVQMELRHDAEAAVALRRALYLDPELVMAHLAIGMVKRRSGDIRGARRSFGTVRRLCGAMPKAEPVPLGDGACAGHVDAVAATQDAGLPPPSSSKHRGY